MLSLVFSMIYYIGGLLVKHYGVSITDLFTAIYGIMFSGVQTGMNIGFISSLVNACHSASYFFSAINIKDLERASINSENSEKNELI